MRQLTFILGLILVPLCGFTKPKPEDLQFLAAFKRGLIAQCKQSVIFELQMISEPKYLKEEDLHQIISLLGGADNYSTSLPGCTPYYDFKLILADGEHGHLVELRICSSCGQIGISYDQDPKTGGALTGDAREKLGALLDSWFPGWRDITNKNRQGSEKELNLESSVERSRHRTLDEQAREK